MVAIWRPSESRITSCFRFCSRNVLNRLCSARVCSSFGSSALSSVAVLIQVQPRNSATMAQAATAPMRSGSLTRVPTARRLSSAPASGEPLLRLRLRPGRRLTVIIMACRVPWRWSRGLPEREADREHEQRGDLVHVQRIEDAVRDRQSLERIGGHHRKPEAIAQDPVQPLDAGAAAGGEEPTDATGRPAGRLEERGGALDADRQLLAARLEERL